jgi:hypothetical protein
MKTGRYISVSSFTISPFPERDGKHTSKINIIWLKRMEHMAYYNSQP